MDYSASYVPYGDNILDTLVQSETLSGKQKSLRRKVVLGKGSELSNVERLKNRSKRKSIGSVLALGLIAEAQKRRNKELEISFRNTYYCCNELTSHNGRLYGKYCKNLFCPVCLAIRKAEIINKYYSTICQWPDPQLVTLTVVAVKANHLSYMIRRGVLQAWKIILQRWKKRYQRGSLDIKPMGIKSLECNFNPKFRTYNPHLHFIVPDLKTARYLRKEWMLQWKSKKRLFVSIKAQDIIQIKDKTDALKEVIKYGSKIFTQPDTKKTAPKNQSRTLYIKAFYNIVSAFKGLRLFERFGFNLPKQQAERTKTEIIDYLELTFDLKQTDWIYNLTGVALTGYTHTFQLKQLLEAADYEVA